MSAEGDKSKKRLRESVPEFTERKTVRLDEYHSNLLEQLAENGEYHNESDILRAGIEALAEQENIK